MATEAEAKIEDGGPAPKCTRCDGQGWYFRVPDGFNPFLAGGFATARAAYRVDCICSRTTLKARKAGA